MQANIKNKDYLSFIKFKQYTNHKKSGTKIKIDGREYLGAKAFHDIIKKSKSVKNNKKKKRRNYY
jgi:hypothetical protein